MHIFLLQNKVILPIKKFVLLNYRDVPDSGYYRIVGDQIPDIGYQIQFYAKNQCDFVLSQLCFEDLKQSSHYGASERY